MQIANIVVSGTFFVPFEFSSVAIIVKPVVLPVARVAAGLDHVLEGIDFTNCTTNLFSNVYLS